jgi:hypothetical protein
MWFSYTPAVVHLALAAEYRQVAEIIDSSVVDAKLVIFYNKNVFCFGMLQ